MCVRIANFRELFCQENYVRVCTNVGYKGCKCGALVTRHYGGSNDVLDRGIDELAPRRGTDITLGKATRGVLTVLLELDPRVRFRELAELARELASDEL